MLGKAGAPVDVVDAYRTVLATAAELEPLRAALARCEVGAVVYASPSAVRAVVEAIGLPADVPAVAIGGTTAVALQAARALRIVTAARPEDDALEGVRVDLVELAAAIAEPDRQQRGQRVGGVRHGGDRRPEGLGRSRRKRAGHLFRLITARQQIRIERELAQQGLRPAAIDHVQQQRAAGVAHFGGELAGQPAANIIFGKQHLHGALKVFRLVVAQPEDFWRREAGERGIGHQLDELAAAAGAPRTIRGTIEFQCFRIAPETFTSSPAASWASCGAREDPPSASPSFCRPLGVPIPNSMRIRQPRL